MDPACCPSGNCQPPPAEIARTVVARERSAWLACGSYGGRWLEPIQVMLVDQPDGRPLIKVPPNSSPVLHLAQCPVVQLSIPTRRSSLSLVLTGPAQPLSGADGPSQSSYRISPLSLTLAGADEISIPLADYYAASPDPLWRDASAILQHLEQGHSAELLACVRAQQALEVEAVQPTSLDRFGLELALISVDGVTRARLAFPGGAVTSLEELGASMLAVLTCSCSPRDLRPSDG